MAIRSALLVATLLVPLSIGAAQASGAGDNVVVIDVTKVLLPRSLPGECRVSGFVDQVRDGSAFHAGQTISVAVPCGAHAHLEGGPAISPSGPTLQDIEVLKKSKSGLAHLNDGGELIWQPTKQSYGTMGSAVGYRVLDGVSLPISPASPI